jgi:copper chaperone CopZ
VTPFFIVLRNINKNMSTIKFKTNIKCDACVAKVTPSLNETVGANLWRVDLSDPFRTLSIDKGDEHTVVEALKKIGYRAEKV